MFFIAILFFILGALCASFAGVLAGRLYTGESILGGRSRCDACGKRLNAFSLIPIVSYLASGGRAQCCRSRVSGLSTVGEALLGILFAAAYLKIELSFALVPFLLALVFLYALTVYDLVHSILPPSLLALFCATAIAFAYCANDAHDFFLTLGVAFLLGLSLFLLHVLSRGRAMGLADAPLASGLALLVGLTALSGFVLSFWIGALVGIIILARTPKGSRMGIEVPFAPFLAAGFLLAYFTQWDPLTFITTLETLPR